MILFALGRAYGAFLCHCLTLRCSYSSFSTPRARWAGESGGQKGKGGKARFSQLLNLTSLGSDSQSHCTVNPSQGLSFLAGPSIAVGDDSMTGKCVILTIEFSDLVNSGQIWALRGERELQRNPRPGNSGECSGARLWRSYIRTVDAVKVVVVVLVVGCYSVHLQKPSFAFDLRFHGTV
ncbi:hypothetical protein E2C01_029431 [Portunus trituberculatus]|uniref:Uncharacterized protein n=1 Tax=Portunus trituberculatus TaxID=210409 RepID=A0A5B7ENF9_PORTR|nr:hypothetical protein [Portunus trituberculatus]